MTVVPRLVRADRLLADGLHALGRDLADGCRTAVLACRADGGGFRGRQGDADLWYTDFAIRTLTLTGAPDTVFSDAARWLRLEPAVTDQPGLFNRVNLERLCHVHRPAAALPTATPQASTSAYALLLDAATRDLLGHRQPRDLPRLVAPLARSDGGFAERADARESQANASAAVLAALALAGRLDRCTRDTAVAFLCAQQGDDGGIRAHPGIPAGDLLSTFTTVWALTACNRLDRLRLGDCGRFTLRCRTAGGGFAATPDDGHDDTEYTYYGLAVLALLRVHADSGAGALGRWRRWWRLAIG